MQEHLQNIIDNPSFLNEASLEVKETHISTVLIGENVYKFKKPIRLDFVDQESLESRALLCFEEWRLNRRLSPRVYLGVDLLARKEDRLKLFPWPGLEREPPAFSIVLSEVESHGWTVQDICVRMEHLADANRLEEKVSELDASDMDRLAEKIASFHRSLPSRPPSSGFGHRLKNVLTGIKSNGGYDYSPSLNTVLERYAKSLNTRRYREVDGHGDLRPDHIYLGDTIEIIDCVEFSSEIRQVDPYEDLAFATMGLRLDNRPDLARHLALSYLHRMCDVRGFLLMDLYEIYRAAVRLMVDALQLKEAEGEKRSAYLQRRSEAYRELIDDLMAGKKSMHHRLNLPSKTATLAHNSAGQKKAAPSSPGWKTPLLILLSGLPATGKSRIAALIREEGIPVLSSDVLRKKDEARPEIRKPEAYGQGAYSSKKKMRNYRKLICQAARLFEKESIVCLDASFSKAQYRKLACSMASHLSEELQILILQTDCSEEIIRRRLDKRRNRPGISDLTDFNTWKKLKENFEPVDVDKEAQHLRSEGGARLHHLILDTSGDKRTSIGPELKKLVPDLFVN